MERGGGLLDLRSDDGVKFIVSVLRFYFFCKTIR
jgi:hypothetical protein